jgi:hypothetical protein
MWGDVESRNIWVRKPYIHTYLVVFTIRIRIWPNLMNCYRLSWRRRRRWHQSINQLCENGKNICGWAQWKVLQLQVLQNSSCPFQWSHFSGITINVHLLVSNYFSLFKFIILFSFYLLCQQQFLMHSPFYSNYYTLIPSQFLVTLKYSTIRISSPDSSHKKIGQWFSTTNVMFMAFQICLVRVPWA